MTLRARHAATRMVPSSLFLIGRFAAKHRYLPNLIRPSSFNEKILCKMLFDRDQRLPTIADKLEVRKYIGDRVGTDLLPRIYETWAYAKDIDIKRSWGPFVLKANHGSGFLRPVKFPDKVDLAGLRAEAAAWVSINWGRQQREWCYAAIQPKLFAEEWIGPVDRTLIDYKFFCFSGEPKFMKIIANMTSCPQSIYCDMSMNPIELFDGQMMLDAQTIQWPQRFDEMKRIAATLSKGFDFLRVDMFNTEGKIVVGELTNYPLGAAVRFYPRSADFFLGTFWQNKEMRYLPFNRLKRALRGQVSL